MGPLSVTLWGVTLWGGTLQLSPNEIPACHCHLMGCRYLMGWHPPVVTLWVVTLWGVTLQGVTLWDVVTLWGVTLHLSPYGTPEHRPMGCHLMGWHPPIVTLWVP